MVGCEDPATPYALIQLGSLEGLGIYAVLNPLPLLATQLGILSPVGVNQVRYTLINADIRFNLFIYLFIYISAKLTMVLRECTAN